jgi:hypothetical protein
MTAGLASNQLCSCRVPAADIYYLSAVETG